MGLKEASFPERADSSRRCEKKGTIEKVHPDNNLKRVYYTNAQIATPEVNFEYDLNYNRVAKMTDGTGETAYAYNPIAATPALGAGRLAGLNGPLGNDVIQYAYDELGRVTSRAINSVASSVVYDALGRVSSATNPLGTFNYNYINTTARLASIAYPNGQQTQFSYYGNSGDQRLRQILHLKPDTSTLSSHTYEYNPEGQITKWTQQADAGTPTAHEFEYDSIDQLLSATLKNSQTQAIVKRFLYSYDKAGNRVSEQIDGGITKASYNSANQLTSKEAGGPMKFKGSLNETGTVTVQGKAASMVSSNRFEGTAEVLPGTNVVPVIAKDYSGNEKTNRYQVVVPSGETRTLTYDNNGNCTSDGVRTFEWDAKNQLVAINQGTHRSEMVYDGIGRRVQIIEKENGAEVSNKRFVWVGRTLAEERDSSGAIVAKRFYLRGVQVGENNFYYTQDHLASIREMLDASGTIRARYEYDPYGRKTKVSGDLEADFGFTGHYYHVPSGLCLATYRGYDPELGRWLNRDPIGEAGGMNLYSYCHGSPSRSVDSLGLQDFGTYDMFSGQQLTFDEQWRAYEANERENWRYERAERFSDQIVPDYGHWGGPDYSGGWRPSQHSGENGPLGPIDDLDAAAQRHDEAYRRAGVQAGDPNSNCGKIKDPCQRKKCFQKQAADNKIVNDAAAAKPTSLYGRAYRAAIMSPIAPFNTKEEVPYFVW
ncbi:MAG: hypothetical protein PHV34_24235 [Verrucomicrobiae bacterium]|nr:hypothetical protein [Verrucomicrobiae bacterium]